MPTIAGFTVDTLRGNLLPALAQRTVSTGPLVVNTDKAKVVDSPFESETEFDTPEAALAAAATHRAVLGGLISFGGTTVLVKDVRTEPKRDAPNNRATLYTVWILVASPDWVPDA